MTWKYRYPDALLHDMHVDRLDYRPSWTPGKPILVVNHFTVTCGVEWPGAGRFGTEGIGPAFGIRRDGTVCQYVDLDRGTWHARDCSHYGVGIEYDASPPACPINEAQLLAGAALNAWLCETFGFPAMRSPGIAYVPGIKVHTDGLEDGGAKWDSARHYDSIWKAAGDPIIHWISGAQIDTLNSSPWTAQEFVDAVALIIAPKPPPKGFLMALTDAEQTTVYYRALETGAELAGRKIRLGVSASPTVELADGSKKVVTKDSTAADFGKDGLGLFNAFKTGLAG